MADAALLDVAQDYALQFLSNEGVFDLGVVLLGTLMVLGLGAGATGQEAAHAKTSDVATVDGEVAVALRRLRRDGTWRERRAILLPDYRARLVELAAASPGTYLLGGSATFAVVAHNVHAQRTWKARQVLSAPPPRRRRQAAVAPRQPSH
jgi:hypothetical protein